MLKKVFGIEESLNKKQMISMICILIVFSGVFGWIYEFIFYFINSGFQQFYMRGSNYLPWINIYVYGSFLILFLTYRRRKKPLQVFLISVISTGLLEYLSGYILYEKLGRVRCWSYNEEILNFGNIGGFVCLRSVLVFGLSGLLLVYYVVPTIIKIMKKGNPKTLLIISITICSIFIVDELYNLVLYQFFPFPRAHDFYSARGIPYIYFSR